ncbi:MAG: hypothetical protein QXQ70_07825, partial [Candidatus Caldarchaeum sp.]
RAHAAAALYVADTVLEDTVEERLPLLRRAVGIGACEPQHRVLHDVECIVLVAHGDLCDPERPDLDLGEEADRLERAVARVLDEGWRTPDIWTEGTTKVGTEEMGRKVIEALSALSR